MKNIKAFLFLSVFICIGNLAYSQLGIGNTSPQKSLHISGTSSSEAIENTSAFLVKPTIRVEGLNLVNNNHNPSNLRPLSVSDKGDFVVSHALVKPLLMIDPINTTNTETDYIPSAVTINQTATSTTTNSLIRSFTFVLTSPSMVKMGVSTSFRFRRASDGGVITDGSNRIWGTRLRFSAAPSGVPTGANAYFGEYIHPYVNTVNIASATGLFYANSEESIFLPAGNYTVDVNLFASTNSSQPPLRIIYGEGIDTVSIVAFPVQ